MARNTTTMQTQPQTYMTTKIGHTNHTIGTGLVTALDTFTYQDEGCTNDEPLGIATGLPSEHNNSSLLGKSTYEQQKLAMQQNRQHRVAARRLKRSMQNCVKVAALDGSVLQETYVLPPGPQHQRA